MKSCIQRVKCSHVVKAVHDSIQGALRNFLNFNGVRHSSRRPASGSNQADNVVCQTLSKTRDLENASYSDVATICLSE